MIRNILVVDDDAIGRKLLAVTLDAEGFVVFQASDGVEALAVLGEQNVDVIISDILMPRMDGYRLCSEVRKNEKFHNLPFIIYSCAYTSESDEKLAVRVGADRYIRKPVSTKVLVDAIRGVPRQSNRSVTVPSESEVMKEYNEALVRMVEDANADLARALAQHKCLAELSLLSLTSSDSAVLMDELVRAVLRELDADLCGYWELLPDGQRLLLQSGVGWNDGIVGSATVSANATDSQEAYTLRSKDPVVVQQLELERRFRAAALLFQHGAVSGISIGIHGAQAPQGVLSAYTKSQRTFRPENILFLQSTANVIAAGIGRTRAEDGLRRAVDEISAAKISAEKAKAAAETANAAKDRFLAVLSHELRTPLAPVLTAVTTLQKHSRLDTPTREILEMVRRNVELEARLIDDLLDLTRISQGKVELDKRETELCTIIRRAVEVCQPDIQARQLHFDMDLGPAPYLVKADSTRLQQVFWNLIKNAIKFTPHGGCVGVRYRPGEAGQVVIEVSDSGVGIEPAALGRIFGAFEQAERSITRQFGGLGLGLAISKSLVEMHGGTLEAFSDGKGKGATFRVCLPVLAGSGNRPIEAGKPKSKPAQSNVSGSRLLIVEDHGDTAQTLCYLLESEGYLVETAGDVATALDLLARQRFDVLISDLGLPDASGLDLMRELRARGQAVPGIALSGYGQEQDVQQSRSAGFAAHMIKPVDIDHLLSMLRSLVVV